MVTVRVDGQPLAFDISGIRTLPDLIELIKMNISPESIITGIKLNGLELTDAEWRSPLAVHSGKTLDITSGAKQAYIAERLRVADVYVNEIINKFSKVSECFARGASMDGNSAMAVAVDDLNAFVSWYQTVLSLSPDTLKSRTLQFQQQVEAIRGICEQLVQLQLYQSWRNLGEALTSRLAPQLRELKEVCASA